MPNVKKGSIIELKYNVASDYYSSMNPWYFQNLFQLDIVNTILKFQSSLLLIRAWLAIFLLTSKKEKKLAWKVLGFLQKVGQ